MFIEHWRDGCLSTIAVAALFAWVPAGAQSGADRDLKEISAYKLTEAGLAKYTQAAQKVAEIEKSTPGRCSADEGDDDDGNGKSIDQVVASLDANAKVRSAIQSTGMSSREYVVFGMAVFQAGMAAWALDQPGGKLPAGVQMGNVTFYRQHEAAMKKLGESSTAAECEDDAR